MKLFGSIAQVAGLVVLTAGVFFISIAAGLIVGGLCLLLLGFVLGMSK